MASSSPVKIEMIESENNQIEPINNPEPPPPVTTDSAPAATPAAAPTPTAPAPTVPTSTENSANVDKMLQVFQQLASQQGTQSAGIQQQILQQQVMQQLQLQQAVAAVQTLQKQLADQFELARNLVRDLQHSPSKQSNQQSNPVFQPGQVRAGSVAEGLATGRQSGASCRSMLSLQPQGSPNSQNPASSSSSNRNDLINSHSNSTVSLLRPQHGLPPLAARGRPHFHPGQMDDSIQLEELERFAKDFKQKRIKLGFTQGDVGVAMGRLYGSDFSQTTISRFEALNLSFKNMCKLKPILERWLDDAERYLNPSSTSMTEQQLESARRRKKRTSIDSTIKGGILVALEMAFLRNSRPSSAEISKLAEELEMERETVRVWFCNRRQKEKRIGSNGDEESVSNPDSPVSGDQQSAAALNPPQIPLHPSSPTPTSSGPFNAMAAAVAAATAPAANGNANWSGNLDFYRHFASNLNHKNFVMAAQAAQAAAVQAAQQAGDQGVSQSSPFSFFPNMSPMMQANNTPAEVTELSAQQKPIAS